MTFPEVGRELSLPSPSENIDPSIGTCAGAFAKEHAAETGRTVIGGGVMQALTGTTAIQAVAIFEVAKESSRNNLDK